MANLKHCIQVRSFHLAFGAAKAESLSSEDELRFLNNTVDRRRIADGR